jgi:Na+/proline symporter
MTGSWWRIGLQVAPWAVVGAGAALGVVSILTIGIFVLPATGALAAALIWKRHTSGAAPGILAGLAFVPLYVAYLNRSGPGFVCATSAVSQTCTQEMSPWPWVAASCCFVAAAVLLGRTAARRSRVHSGR